jgi:hypothetical protein
VGGFIGYADAIVKVESCYSNITVAIDSSATTSDKGDETYVGGFVGKKNATFSYCYAKGDVSIASYGGVFVGGFLGYTSGNTGTTSSCYATGNVSVVSRGTGLSMANNPQDTMAGGFSGYSASVGLTSNCYALGDVFLSKEFGTGTVYAGGFAGQLTNSNASNCFAKGKVTAQRNESGNSNAGGFAGRINGTFNNIAALGESVTTTGGTERNFGRIYGTAGGTLRNSHAYNGMKLYRSATFGVVTEIDRVTSISGSHDNQHGKDLSFSDFHYDDFFIFFPPSGDNAPTTIHGLGFSDADWIFTTVGYYGYPILRASKNGPALGGQ